MELMALLAIAKIAFWVGALYFLLLIIREFREMTEPRKNKDKDHFGRFD